MTDEDVPTIQCCAAVAVPKARYVGNARTPGGCFLLMGDRSLTRKKARSEQRAYVVQKIFGAADKRFEQKVGRK